MTNNQRKQFDLHEEYESLLKLQAERITSLGRLPTLSPSERRNQVSLYLRMKKHYLKLCRASGRTPNIPICSQF